MATFFLSKWNSLSINTSQVVKSYSNIIPHKRHLVLTSGGWRLLTGKDSLREPLDYTFRALLSSIVISKYSFAPPPPALPCPPIQPNNSRFFRVQFSLRKFWLKFSNLRCLCLWQSSFFFVCLWSMSARPLMTEMVPFCR